MNDRWKTPDYVTLPVKLINGRWELLYGGSTGIREQTYGELRVAMSSIEDEQVRQRMGQTVTVKVLDEGTELLVALTDHEYRSRRNEPSFLDRSLIDAGDLPGDCNRVERIWIGDKSAKTARIDPDRGGLWIRQRGVDRTDLLCSGIRMPEDFDHTQANSLNHGCTLLSERYEKQRISHTVNVYKHVFYREPDSGWRPLETLRKGVIASIERSIVADAWGRLTAELGFRPVGKVDAKQR